jgi:hypothetical protein
MIALSPSRGAGLRCSHFRLRINKDRQLRDTLKSTIIQNEPHKIFPWSALLGSALYAPLALLPPRFFLALFPGGPRSHYGLLPQSYPPARQIIIECRVVATNERLGYKVHGEIVKCTSWISFFR